ncbi:hypothetical protein TrRE_jg10584 [Triparma retinervis]|uniref:2-oxoacid dehydrogenase acyltransferase catalytic domain-containing protein n=1 Tax=Triparma retinervis TaxID=2557542 RepID=A0A9W7ANE3_9STRA|nr:hypothetical protein TrRE_jg10584 [Triparma retinervis]
MSQSTGVDATVLYPGTGLKGRVTKGDVIMALKEGKVLPPLSASSPPAPVTSAAPPAQAAPSPAAAAATTNYITTNSTYTDVPNSSMRKIIAKRLTQSKAEVPHFYTTTEVPLDSGLALRKSLAGDHGVKVSVNDLVIKASALALRDFPQVNLSPTVDISVAVATPSGLITPIVPMTDTLGLSQISSKVRDLATRARDGKLKPEEYQGGSFTISNLGMFGISSFSAVINPPQAAILAVGGGIPKLVPPPDGEGPPVEKTMMTARLSADREKIDEATAAEFMQAFKKYLGDPKLMVL